MSRSPGQGRLAPLVASAVCVAAIFVAGLVVGAGEGRRRAAIEFDAQLDAIEAQLGPAVTRTRSSTHAR